MIYLYENDLPDTLPDNLTLDGDLAIDTETMGLNPHRDRLCLVQISNGDGNAHLVQLKDGTFDCPNMKKLLSNQSTTKLFHYARFDIAIIRHYLNIECGPIFCTKIASKLSRTNTDKHGLRNLLKDLLDVDLDKQQQCTDWGVDEITQAQQKYAANDVLYLHRARDILTERLNRDNRLPLAEECFKFLPARATLDLAGWGEDDIFAHR